MSKNRRWQPPPELWEKLKPLARQVRHEPTPAENILWDHLRNRQMMGFKFRRQHPVNKFITDFYYADARLVIEIDGDIHQYTVEEDTLRGKFLEGLGFKILRFTNEQVFDSLQGVLEQIVTAISENRFSDSPSLLRREGRV